MNERIPILFDRDLRPERIDFALEQWMKHPDEEEYRRILREYLSERVQGAEAAIKTASQLQRNVGPRSAIPQERLAAIYQAMEKLAPDSRGPLRVSVLTESMPIVADCLSAIRKMDLLGNENITTRQLYERIVPKYGDRASVYRTIQRVVQTLVNLGVVERQGACWCLVKTEGISIQ